MQKGSDILILEKYQKEFIEKLGTQDYHPTKNQLTQKAITYIFGLIINKGKLYLDFDDITKIAVGKSKNTNNQEIGIAPPSLWTMVKICLQPEYQILKSHMEGKWHCTRGSIVDFLLLLDSQSHNFISKLYRFRKRIIPPFFILKQYLNRKESTKKTKKHYDWSPRLYEQILGKYMVYSCAFFDGEHNTLDEAQENKINTTINRLEIDSPDMKVLDIGCGWGELMKQITKKTGAETHGISISKKQIKYAKKRNNNSDKKKIVFEEVSYDDYKKDESDIHDRIVSVGMLEHVGKTGYKKFFGVISNKLKPEGKALIHCITKHEKKFSNRWIDKYIFHGGYIPRVSEVVNAAEADKKLILETAYFHSGDNYVRTLQFWLKNLISNYEKCLEVIECKVREEEPNLDELNTKRLVREKIRMWFTYLTAIQIIFMQTSDKPNSVHQFVVRKTKENH